MMAQAHSVTPQSRPPKSRSVSAKRQQGTSSRLTRSRSRELGEGPAPLSFKVPSVPQRSDDATRRKSVPRTPRTSDVSSRGNGLSTIKEHRTNDTRHGLEFSPGHQSNISQTYVAESQADHGNISGTTMLQIDDSEQESDELDPHLILDTLPDLLNASNKALDLLAPPGISYTKISKHFQTPKFAARLNRIRETFQTQKKCIGKANFIPVERSAVALSSIKQLNWKPQGLYQKANLAQLALDLINPHPTTSTAVADDNFPVAFVDSFPSGLAGPSGEEDCRREIVQLGLELRTQRFIANLQSDTGSQSSGPEELLEDVFYNPSLGEYDAGLKGWTMNGLENDEDQLPEEFHDIVQERILLIRRLLSRKGDLEAEFPWSDFVIDIANWIRRRADDIDQQLSSQRPVEEAVKILQAELDKRSSFGPGNPLETTSDPILDEVESPVERNTTPERPVECDDREIEESEAATSPTARPHRRFRGKGALQRVLTVGPVEEIPPILAQPTAVEVNGEPQAAENPVPRPRRRFQGKGALRRVLAIGPSNEAPSTLPPATGNGTIPSPGQDKEAPAAVLGPGKDPRINSEEPSASLLQNSPPRPTPRIGNQESPQNNGLNNRHEEELPPLSSAEIWRLSEEGKKTLKIKQENRPRGAFIDRQADARRVSPISFTPSPRPNGPPARSPQKRSAAEALDHHDDESEEDDDEFETDNRPPKKRRVANTPAPPRPTPASGPHIASTSNSRQASISNNSATGTAPPPQRFEQVAVETQPVLNWTPRRAWSLEEEACLRELIDECGGPAWSEIKKRDSMAGNILFKRTQVQIKDKGGQMHYDDLMAGRPLSDAMANVPIKTKMRERLIREGKMDP
ncbi:hypothetical protein MauCBS54593_000166 [Microsporum audouinii]